MNEGLPVHVGAMDKIHRAAQVVRVPEVAPVDGVRASVDVMDRPDEPTQPEAPLSSSEVPLSPSAAMAKVHGAGIRQPAPVMDAVRLPEPVAEAEDQESREDRELTWESFDEQARTISMAIKSKGRSKRPHVVHEELHQEFVENVEDGRLQKFGKLILIAPRIVAEDKQVTELREKRRKLQAKAKPGEKKEQLPVSEQAQLEQSVRWTCAFNQMIGSLVEDAEEAMPPKNLIKWLHNATGRPNWAEKVVFGVQTERAGEKLVREVSGIDGIMHGDLDQDLQGQDIIFDETPAGYTALDVKSREHRGVMPVMVDEEERVTLYIDPGHMERNGYAVKEQYVPGYKQLLTKVLIKGEKMELPALDADDRELADALS
jgi:hypothetical protein